MIYEFYNIIGKKRTVQRIGLSNSFSIGFGKYMDNIIDLYEKDDKVMLTPIIRANLKRLREGDTFIVGVRVKDDLYTVGIHVAGKDDGPAVSEKVLDLYDELCAEIRGKKNKEVWGNAALSLCN